MLIMFPSVYLMNLESGYNLKICAAYINSTLFFLHNIIIKFLIFSIYSNNKGKILASNKSNNLRFFKSITNIVSLRLREPI